MQNVKKDRHKYIGGSDIPIIMGISPFKSRFDLLLEKAQLKDDDFEGNEYTEYGNILEPQIREYINRSGIYLEPFKEDKVIDGDLRYHADGFNGSCVLEIKTTSQIHENVDDYKIYLVQLLFGMQMNKVENGLLAVYHRVDNWDESMHVKEHCFDYEFKEKYLKIYSININDYVQLLIEINEAVEKFRIDLQKVKDNPLITEEELQPNELIELSNEVEKLEKQLLDYKEIEERRKKVNQELFKAMEKHNVKKWITNNGTQITRVDSKPDEEVDVTTYDEKKFIEENTELHEAYHNKLAEYKVVKKEIKKGKSGYVKITLPKEE